MYPVVLALYLRGRSPRSPRSPVLLKDDILR